MHTTLIDAPTLSQHIEQLNWIVFDCRFSLKDTNAGRQKYEEGHLPDAIYLHLDDDLSGPILPNVTGRHPLPDPAIFATLLGNKGVTNNSQVVAYDDIGGAIASRLWWMLKWLGHEAVAVLDGGIHAWLQHGFPLDTQEPQLTHQTYTPNIRDALVASVEDVERRVEGMHSHLIDARTNERYRGLTEPIDPVAGHIPGAQSLPFKDNLAPDNRFKSSEALAARFAHTQVESIDPIVYCGSGVTACHNSLAMVHAGYPMPKLYPGSWSHWITDPKHPVARD